MSTINIRIEDKTKAAASKALSDIGLDLSSGIKVFLHQVIAERGLPFTPTKNPAALRAKWNAAFEDGLKNGKRFKSGRDVLRGL